MKFTRRHLTTAGAVAVLSVADAGCCLPFRPSQV